MTAQAHDTTTTTAAAARLWLTARPRAGGHAWAVEVELTPKPLARTARIMSGLLSLMWYAQVIYLTAPAAAPVVTRAAASVHEADRARVVVRELPPSALGPEVSR